MRTTPRVILILKQASSATRRCEILAKKIAVTVNDTVPSSFSFSLFTACFVLVAHNIVALQSEIMSGK